MDSQTKKYIALSGGCIAIVALAGAAALPLVSNPVEKSAIAAEAQKPDEMLITMPSSADDDVDLNSAYSTSVSTTPLQETKQPIIVEPPIDEQGLEFDGLGDAELVITEEEAPLVEEVPVVEPVPEPVVEPAPIVEQPAPEPVVEQPVPIVEPAPVVEQPAPAPVIEQPAPVPVAEPVVIEQPAPVAQEIPEPVIEYIDGVPSRDIERAIYKTPAGYHYVKSYFDPNTKMVTNHYMSDTGVLKVVSATSLSTLRTYNTYDITT